MAQGVRDNKRYLFSQSPDSGKGRCPTQPLGSLDNNYYSVCCAEVFNKYLFKEQTSLTPAHVPWPMLEFQGDVHCPENRTLHLLCCCCSVAKSSLISCNPMDCSTPGLPVPHCLPEFARVHVHLVSDAFQPSHLLLPSFFFCFQIFPSIIVFFSALAVHIRRKVSELQLQYQSFQ